MSLKGVCLPFGMVLLEEHRRGNEIPLNVDGVVPLGDTDKLLKKFTRTYKEGPLANIPLTQIVSVQANNANGPMVTLGNRSLTEG